MTTTTVVDDTQIALVEAARAGDRDAFAALYARSRESVRRYVRRRLRARGALDHALADDLTADVYVRALHGIGSFRWQGRDVQAWLVTIARNVVTDYFKAGRTRLEHSVPDLGAWDGLGTVESAEDTALRGMAAIDQRATLEGAINRLTPDQQVVVRLRYQLDMPIAQVAEAMHRTEGSVKTLTYRATRSLARGLIPTQQGAT